MTFLPILSTSFLGLIGFRNIPSLADVAKTLETTEDLDKPGFIVVEGVGEGYISSVSYWVSLIKVVKDFLNSGLSMDQSIGKCRVGSNELARKVRLVRSVLVLDSIGVTKSIGLGYRTIM